MRLVVRLAIVGAVALVTVAAPASSAPGGAIEFASPAFWVDEHDALAVITVERTSPLAVGRTTVDYATSPNTAQPPGDYAESSGTLVFEVGDRTKTFTVPIRDDDLDEDTEELVLVLSNVRGDTVYAGRPAALFITGGNDALQPGAAAGQSGAVRPSAQGRSVSAPAPPAGRVVAAEPARSRAKRAEAPQARRLTYRQRGATPLELRNPAPGAAPMAAAPGEVDPLFALLAGLLLARVAAQVWFRCRLQRVG